MWSMPIKNRLDMLTTGIRTPVGIKIFGPDLATLDSIGRQIEALLPAVSGTNSVFAERAVGGRDARFPVEGNSERYAPDIVRKVWRLANSMGYGEYYVNERANGIIDDHYFINSIAKIPTIDIINMPADGEGHVGHEDRSPSRRVDLDLAGDRAAGVDVVHRPGGGGEGRGVDAEASGVAPGPAHRGLCVYELAGPFRGRCVAIFGYNADVAQ